MNSGNLAVHCQLSLVLLQPPLQGNFRFSVMVQVLLYVHRNRRIIRDRGPRTSASTFTQLLSSERFSTESNENIVAAPVMFKLAIQKLYLI